MNEMRFLWMPSRLATASRAAAPTLCTLALTGCLTVGPDYAPPEATTPDRWHQELVGGMSSGDAKLQQWWTYLDDPLLNDLVERARSGNLDLQTAAARVAEARAARGVAIGERVPDVDAAGLNTRSRQSNDIRAPGQDSTAWIFDNSVGASWEMDFWGRVRRNIAAADADFGASVEDYRDALVLLYAELATTYIEVRSLQARIEFNLGNIRTQKESLQLVVDRNRAGLSSDLDVRQAEFNLARTESFLPTLYAALNAAVNRIGVLLGEPPSTLQAELAAAAPIPEPPENIVLNVPADFVRQRPDIRAAERNLAAQTERVGVATTDLYPRFTLDGFFGYQAIDGGAFDSGNRAWSFGPFFTWNLFDGGRVRNRIRIEDARTEQALHSYEQTVLEALEEVENSLVDFVQENDRRDALFRSAVAAEKSVELVLVLYRTGLTDFQNVLDSQRSLFEQQDQLAESEGLVTQNLVRIYTSLGGGWDPEDPVPGATQ